MDIKPTPGSAGFPAIGSRGGSEALIAEIERRYGAGSELAVCLRMSRDARRGTIADREALAAAESRIGRAAEPEFAMGLQALLDPSAPGEGLAWFWQGLRDMASMRLEEAAADFGRAGNASGPLDRAHLDPFLTVLGRHLGKPLNPAPAAAPAADWAAGAPAPTGRATRPADGPPPLGAFPSARGSGARGESSRRAVLPYQADYAAHPAYAPHIAWTRDMDGAVDGEIDALDARLLDLESRLTLKKIGLREAIDSVLPGVASLIGRIEAGNRSRGNGFQPFAGAFRREIGAMILQDLAYFSRRNGYQPVIRTPEEMNFRNELAARGFMEFDLPRADLEAVRSAFRPVFQVLEARYRAGDRSRERLAENGLDTAPRAVVRDIFERHGFTKAVMDVRHETASAIGMAAELSVHDSDWWRSRYEDAGVPTQKAAYFHNDEGRDVYKAILYLDDVDAEKGPFEYVPGSYPLERPRFQWAASRATITALQSREAAPLLEGMNPSRGVFTSRAARRFMGMLPTRLRASSHFGYDLLDGSPASERLLAERRVMAAPAGRLVVFDGARLVHRGGLVCAGMRRALQINFEVDKSNYHESRAALFGKGED